MEISSEDVVGKHLAEGVGFNRGKHGSRIAEAVRNESAGCSKLRLPSLRSALLRPTGSGF